MHRCTNYPINMKLIILARSLSNLDVKWSVLKISMSQAFDLIYQGAFSCFPFCLDICQKFFARVFFYFMKSCIKCLKECDREILLPWNQWTLLVNTREFAREEVHVGAHLWGKAGLFTTWVTGWVTSTSEGWISLRLSL